MVDAAIEDHVKVCVIASGFDAPVAARRVAVQPSEWVRLPLTEEIFPEDSGYAVILVRALSLKRDMCNPYPRWTDLAPLGIYCSLTPCTGGVFSRAGH